MMPPWRSRSAGIDLVPEQARCNFLAKILAVATALQLRKDVGSLMATHCREAALLTVLRGRDHAAIRGIMDELGRSDTRLSESLLATAANLTSSPDLEVVASAAALVARRADGSTVVSALRRCLRPGAPLEARIQACDSLRFVPPREAADVLLLALEDGSPYVVLQACWAASEAPALARQERVSDKLGALLDSPWPDMRVASARAISAVCPQKALPVLITALQSDDPSVRREAAVGLANMGTAAGRALPDLQKALERAVPLDRPEIVKAIHAISGE